ncbi:MAG: 30S ribosomal protein S9 [Verrucomicrobiae bacterium]|nr:30S ribosomal protein S9 [Verrucomicrobiae bacterium]
MQNATETTSTTSPVTPIRAVGRRKTSVARVCLTPGTGKVIVNDREFEDYFTIPSLRIHALEPLAATQSTNKYDVTVKVNGGGWSGQAGAIRLGIARALLLADPNLKPILRAKGMLTRDPRAKERKKYGQPGARKRFQFSKR